ncbi:MAG: DNA-directed RNA polymerase subunit A'' [Thermoplasmata archaeon]
MARKDTLDALRRRKVGAKTASLLVDAGYTMASLKTAKLKEMEKVVPREDAIRALKRLGIEIKVPLPRKKAVPKRKAAPKKKAPAKKAPKKPAKKAAKKPTKKASPKKPKPRPTVPSKVPEPTLWEGRVLKVLEAKERELPSSLVQALAARAQKLKLKKADLEKVIDHLWEQYGTHLVDPNESCGIVSAQSIGEPGTQMSLPHAERVVVRDQGRFRIVPIGELVDGLMKRYPGRVEGATEWCDLPRGASLEVPSLTHDGRIVWKAVRAASRHSHEGGLLRLQTRAGRTITATPNHSFVVRRGGTIVPVYGRELRPGARIPVVRRWTVPESPAVQLDEYLPRDAFWYGSELARARALGPSWRQGYGRDYVVPVAPDALGRHLYGRAKRQIEEGLVYTSPNQGRVALPERLPLDETLGWLIGAYLSEGWPAPHYVNISNTHEAFLSRTRAIAQSMGIGVGEYDNDRGFARGHDLHLRSSILAGLLRAACGAGSANKRVPDFVFAGSDAFLGTLLRAYFEGDGNVTVIRGAIRASSNSKDLLDGIVLLLARFGILASKGRQGRQHTLWIPRRFAPAFRDAIGFESESKRELLDRLCAARDTAYTYDALDMVSGFGSILTDLSRRLRLPTRYVNSFTRRQVIGRATLARHVRRFEERARELEVDVEEDLARLRMLLEEDVIWDEIVAVEKLEPPREPVYDLSVPGLETFTTAEGVVTHNTMRTFHYAGVAEMNVTLGLPRLIEIVDARRVPSTPVMEVFVKDGQDDLDRMRQHSAEIEMTHLEDIADTETDILNNRVVVYPNEAKMRSRGVTWKDLDKTLSKMRREKVKREGERKKKVEAYVMDSDQVSYKRLQKHLETVKTSKIKGIDGVRRAIIRRRGDEYVIYTEGSNLAATLQLPYVDPTRTNSNNITEIYEVLGVEAARNATVREAASTLAEQGLTVDIRHIMLVADMMTNDGDVKAIGRHGISGRKSSVLARAAFEITSHHLLKAAVTGEVDYLDGVAENVIVGQPVTLGTGAVNLVYRTPTKEG